LLAQHVTPRVPSTLTQELYVFGAAGLQQWFVVRPCVASTDMAGVDQLVHSLHLGDVLLADVRQYVKARRDQVCHDLTVVPSSFSAVTVEDFIIVLVMVLLLLLLLLHRFDSLFSRTTWVCRYQKGKISLDLNEARDYGVLGWQ